MTRPKRPKRSARKRRLTELTVRKARAESRAYLIWDAHQRGLALHVQPTGSKAWKAIYSRHGRPRWLHLGDASAIGLADARTLAAEAMLQVAKGQDPAAEKRAERGAGTFAELAEQYIDEHAKKTNKSWRQADALVRRHVLPRWGKLQASTITRGDVKALMARIEAPVPPIRCWPPSVSDLLVGGEGRETDGQSVQARRPERHPEPRTGSDRSPKFRSSGRRSTTPASSPALRSKRSC